MVRNVRVFTNCGEEHSAIRAALKQVLGTLDKVEFVCSQDEADLVIVYNTQAIAEYEKNKQYALFDFDQTSLLTKKPNVTQISVHNCDARLADIMSRINLETSGE